MNKYIEALVFMGLILAAMGVIFIFVYFLFMLDSLFINLGAGLFFVYLLCLLGIKLS
jgi:hypothetical protein